MSSDSSSTDTDSDVDNSVSESVSAVFGAMKQSLAKRSEGNLQKKQNKLTNNSKHRLIYQTFDDSSSESDDSDHTHEPDTIRGSGKATQDTANLGIFIDTRAKGRLRNSDDVDSFFIDKGPASKSENQHDDNVVSFDLTNLGDSTVKSGNLGDSTVESGEDKQEPTEESNQEKRKKKSKDKKSEPHHILKLSSRLHVDLPMNDVYINVDPYHNPKSKKNISNFIREKKEPEIMKKCVITDDFEKNDSIATTHVSARQLKKERKVEREKTKGEKWFDLPATELTDERKHDIAVIKMRKALDPKRFYKANDLKVAPKYFQFGRVVEDASDFYSSRIPKKQRKSTIVEELLADSNFRQYNKRKYEEIQDAKRQGKGPYKHMKRLKNRKR